MSYKVIRGPVTRNGSSSSQPAGPTVAQIREVQTVVGAPIDFGSWLKNFGQIKENPADFNAWLGFGTDSLKILNAARELALKSPLLPKSNAVVELFNKAEKIVGDFKDGAGVSAADAVGVFGEAFGLASEIKLFPVPVQLTLKAAGIGLSAIALVEPLGNVRIGASEPSVLPTPSRFAVVGYDIYKTPDGSIQVVETTRDKETGFLIKRHFDSDSKRPFHCYV